MKGWKESKKNARKKKKIWEDVKEEINVLRKEMELEK